MNHDDFGVPEPANLSDLGAATDPIAESSVRLALLGRSERDR